MRPSDWSPVGLDADPTPGDPVLVLAGGQEYQEVARSIDNAASAMSRLDVEGTISQAVDSLMSAKEDTIGEIRKAPFAVCRRGGRPGRVRVLPGTCAGGDVGRVGRPPGGTPGRDCRDDDQHSRTDLPLLSAEVKAGNITKNADGFFFGTRS
ncbi:hypothetical protein GCM10023198_59270 [Promicromonospora umidemergens]|uniref:Uncharacterized protein n=1 Tax=Promicromonospora umidemergens TaxID=629679 RepID=A0ABP8YFY8_9MICO